MNRQIINAAPSAAVLNAVQAEKLGIYAKNAMADEPAELLIYEEVGKDPFFGTGIGPRDVTWFLAQNKGKAVNVRINSPGGLVFDGVTIYNSLIQHDGPVTCTIEGVAASAAGLIAMAGSPVRMFANATFQCHRALCIAIGNTHEMSDCAEFLNKIDGQIAATLAAKTGRKKDTMLKLMDGAGKADGTWFSAEEAKAEGFVDEIVPLPKNGKQAKNDAPNVTATDDAAPEAAKAAAQAAVTASLEAELQRKTAKARADRRLRLMEVGQ